MRIAVLPGDGIGPEITAAAIQALECVDAMHSLGLELQAREIGFAALKAKGSTLPDAVVEACGAAQGIVLGPVSHLDYPPRSAGGINPSGGLRLALDLYANIRPARSREGLPHWGRTPMDLVIVRENTEGFYSDRNMYQGIGEFMPTAEVALSVRKITAHASRRIAQIWVAEKHMQFFLFPAERNGKTGAVLRFPGWRYVHQEGWTGAVTEHSGVCFMAAIRGRDKDLETYIARPKQ